MGADRRRYDCFLYVTGGVREIVYFFVPLQETSLLMHVSVALEEAKAWIYLILFCVDIGKGKIYFFLSFLWKGMKGGLSMHLPAVLKRITCKVCMDFKNG